MKRFVLIVCVAVACTSVYGVPTPSFRDIHNECQSDPSTHVDHDVFKTANNGGPYNKKLVESHMLCMSTKSGTQNEDGSINTAVVKKILSLDITDASQLEKATKKCAVEGPTPGETALKLNKCIRENTGRGSHDHSHHEHQHEHHHDHLHEIH